MTSQVKGILTAKDAAIALDHGVNGIIVSNHGGRQIDGTLAAIEALPEIVEQVAGRVDVLMDGGIRRGTDVLKALAPGSLDRPAGHVGFGRGRRDRRKARAGDAAGRD